VKTRHGLEIRAAVGSDAPGICELLRASGEQCSPHALADRLDAIRQSAGTALIAAAWGPPSGIVVLHWYRTMNADPPTAQITTLLVDPNERRRGIGRLLLKAAAHAARAAGCGELTLLVPPEAPALREFCQVNGFVHAGRGFARGLRKRS